MTEKQYYAIKCKLKSICYPKDYDFFKELNEIVLRYNTLLRHTYQFIRLFMVHCYTQDLEIPEINRQRIEFFIKTLTFNKNPIKVRTDVVFKERIEAFYEEHYPIKKIEASGFPQLIGYMAKEILTSYSNIMEFYYPKMLERFLQHTIGKKIIQYEPEMNKKERETFLRRFSGELRSAIFFEEEFPAHLKVWHKTYKNKAFPEGPNTYKMLKSNPLSFLKYALYINDTLEKDGKKSFQVLSLKSSFTPSYITLDATAITQLFLKKYEYLRSVKVHKDEIFREYFNLNSKIFRKRKFSYLLKTDGEAVSLIFERNVLKKSSKKQKEPYLTQSNELTSRKVIGIDIGKYNLLYFTDELSKGQNRTLKYTQPQRKQECYFKRSNEVIQELTKEIKEEESSIKGSMSLDFHKFKNYVLEKNKFAEKAKKIYEKRVFRNLKFRRYVRTQQSETKLLNRIEETFGSSEKIVLGLGDYGEKQCKRFNEPSKTYGFRKLLSCRFKVGLVDEFRTSMLCFRCHKNVGKYKEQWRLKECLHCSTSNKRVFLNRDLNGAKNIAMLARCSIDGNKRPLRFTRECKSL